MHQIKIFRAHENEIPSLEKQVNDWLASGGIRVVQIFGNLSPQTLRPGEMGASTIGTGASLPSDVMLVVLHEKA